MRAAQAFPHTHTKNRQNIKGYVLQKKTKESAPKKRLAYGACPALKPIVSLPVRPPATARCYMSAAASFSATPHAGPPCCSRREFGGPGALVLGHKLSEGLQNV